ncbi:MAG TPA: NlpC/P60 family protein [Trebonia sp.]|jgi:cell wall-associated NlpC family hydrolase|nr:NlpC/P60 family protein [Trebonia sp.]
MSGRAIGPIVIGLMVMLLLAFLVVPMLVVGGATLLFAGGSNANCQAAAANLVQPGVSAEATNSIPSNYLKWFQKVGLQYNVSWTVLAGIAKVESNDGRTTLPGVNSASNAFGAAGPMQIGIDGASGNQWGGTAVHPASEAVNGVATDEDGDGVASVYDPADAIAGAAKYLVAHGVQQNVTSAIFAYNHADWYVEEVLSWASTYATGGFTVADANQAAPAVVAANTGQTCAENSELASFVAPNATVSQAVTYAEAQLGKPYLFGGTGPAAFDCSGLVMMAYQAAGVTIARTSQNQWKTLPHVPAAQVVPGDLVFFAGADGTATAPGHVGLVIAKNVMIEAYATGTPVRVSAFGTAQSPPGDGKIVGYAQPWPGKSTKAAVSG